MKNTIEMNTEILVSKRILSCKGLSARIIPHYEPKQLWLEYSPYRDVDVYKNIIKGIRHRIIKDESSKNKDLEKVRQIINEFESKQEAKAYHATITRNIDPDENELVILYVKESEKEHWKEEREALKKLNPMVYICKLKHPQINVFQRMQFAIDNYGYLKTSNVLENPEAQIPLVLDESTMKKEAEFRLGQLTRIFHVHGGILKHFQEGRLQYSGINTETYKGYHKDITTMTRYKELVEKFEQNTNSIVYHVMESDIHLVFLFVNTDIKNYAFNRFDKQTSSIDAYQYNKKSPECSKYESVGLCNWSGALVCMFY